MTCSIYGKPVYHVNEYLLRRTLNLPYYLEPTWVISFCHFVSLAIFEENVEVFHSPVVVDGGGVCIGVVVLKLLTFSNIFVITEDIEPQTSCLL